MSSENNKALVKKSVEIWSTGNLSRLKEIYSPNCIFHQHSYLNHGMPIEGVDNWRKLIQDFRQAFPDFKDSIDDQICEGNKVVTRFTSRGTHNGSWVGLAPSHKKISWTGIVIDKIENGKIVESWANWDMEGALEQVGASHMHTSSHR